MVSQSLFDPFCGGIAYLHTNGISTHGVVGLLHYSNGVLTITFDKLFQEIEFKVKFRSDYCVKLEGLTEKDIVITDTALIIHHHEHTNVALFLKEEYLFEKF